MSISRFLVVVHVRTQLRVLFIKAHHGILFCIVAIMAKQLTLFGKVVPSSVYAQPSTNYEKYFQRNRSLGRSRGDVLKAAQSD